MNNKIEDINGYKFPCCQKYWIIKRFDFSDDTEIFDISMGYSMFYFKGQTLEEAEEYLLTFIKEKAHEKLKAAEKVVGKLNEYLEDERLLTTDQLLEKYKTM
jgi:hypothetical protein